MGTQAHKETSSSINTETSYWTSEMDLTNFDIDKVLSRHRPKLFYKVLAYDEFNPKKCPYLPIAIVVNTFPLRKKDGGHWVALYIDSRKQAIFFDSYGLEPFGKFRLFFQKSRSRYSL